MRRALTIADADMTPYLPLLCKLVDNALKYGVDWKYGGIYRDGMRKGGALVLEKEFWQQSEALVGFLDAYEAFHDPCCLDAFECLWDFINKYMIVHEIGEWRVLLDREGKPIDTDLGNDWKTPTTLAVPCANARRDYGGCWAGDDALALAFIRGIRVVSRARFSRG